MPDMLPHSRRRSLGTTSSIIIIATTVIQEAERTEAHFKPTLTD
jgi:hypothetical protein